VSDETITFLVLAAVVVVFLTPVASWPSGSSP
jgi:hypothetical protein